MMKWMWILLLVQGLAFFSQNAFSQEDPHGATTHLPHTSQEPVFDILHNSVMRGGQALGPSYLLALYEDGRVEFRGGPHVKTHEWKSHYLSKKEYAELIAIIRSEMSRKDITHQYVYFDFYYPRASVHYDYDGVHQTYNYSEEEGNQDNYIRLRHATEKYFHSMEYRCPIENSDKLLPGMDVCANIVEFEAWPCGIDPSKMTKEEIAKSCKALRGN